MNTLSMGAPHGPFNHVSGPTWDERRDHARRELRRATAVMGVLALGAAFHLMRWVGVLVL